MIKPHSPHRDSAKPETATVTTVRLNKALASSGHCSRRKADELIGQGGVTVNGTPAGLGDRVDPLRDIVEVNGMRVDVRPAAGDRKHLYVLLHKPVETVTTASDPEGRRTVLDLLPKDMVAERPVPAGRLDFFSEGALLLTTDGDMVHQLTHPRHHLAKTYSVWIRFSFDPGLLKGKLDIMRNGMTLAEGERLAPVEVNVATPPRPSRKGDFEAQLELVLRQGINRQIRRMCRDLDLIILRLTRTSQGPLTLGALKPGQWRSLSEKDVAKLKEALQTKT